MIARGMVGFDRGAPGSCSEHDLEFEASGFDASILDVV